VAGRGVRLEDIARDVMMLPGTKKVLPALQEMRREVTTWRSWSTSTGHRRHRHLEDLVEELVGDIRDEYESPTTTPAGCAAATSTSTGCSNLERLRRPHRLVLPEGPYETVAGFVMTALGRCPRSATRSTR